MKSQPTLPKWMLFVSCFFALLEIMVSISLMTAPESFLETVDLTAKGVSYVVSMWAVRQLALGVIFALGVWKRSAPMLMSAYVFFLVMFIGDLVIGIQQKENALVISAAVMCVISAAMLFALNKRSKEISATTVAQKV